MVGLHILTNSLRCQFEIPFRCGNDEEQTSLKWERSSYPVVTPVGHFFQFLPKIIQEALKNINGNNFLQYFSVTFNGIVVNFVEKEFCFEKEIFENRNNVENLN